MLTASDVAAAVALVVAAETGAIEAVTTEHLYICRNDGEDTRGGRLTSFSRGEGDRGHLSF